MNCQSFQNQLYEYVEGSLSASVQAAAAQHLAGCSVCRQAVRREQGLAQIVSSRLRQDTRNLTLDPGIRNRILTASAGESSPPGVLESIAGVWNRFARLAAVPASLLLVAAILVARNFRGIPGDKTEVAGPTDHPLPTGVVIEFSYRVPTRTFHNEGNRVVDSLSDEAVIASGTFQPGQEN